MADDRYRHDYRQQSQDDRYAQPHSQATQQQSQYPPPPGDHRDASRPHDDHRSSMAASVSLPSMHDPRAPGYGPPPHGQSHAYPTDPRYAASPSATNGYPPPPGQQPGPGGYLPPLAQSDPRAAGYRPPEHYNAGGRPPPAYPQDPQYQHPDPYYYRQQPPPPPGPPNAYPYPPPQGAYPPEYAQQGGPQMAQAAPRQRTSIACKYCRKRKIRCSGYQSAPGGKCQNCARMNQECVFQPVSSSSSTAFIPVSAVPGGVPPGTPLYGAYGQPLAPQAHPYAQGGPQQQPQQQPPPGPYYQHPPQGPPPHQGPPTHQPQGPHMQQGPPAQSPAESSYSFTSATRTEEGSQTGRRRRRSSEDQDESYRLPPPRVGATEEEPRRRSPAEFSSRSSPGGLGLPPFSSRHSPRNPTLPQLATQNQTQPGHDGRSPAQPNISSGGSTPARQGQPTAQTPTHQPASQSGQQQQQGKQGSSVMSLSNLMDNSNNTNIDRGMLDRLNKPKDTKPSQ